METRRGGCAAPPDRERGNQRGAGSAREPVSAGESPLRRQGAKSAGGVLRAARGFGLSPVRISTLPV
jgi:hypothetical protein